MTTRINYQESRIEHLESTIKHRESSVENRESVLTPIHLSRELYKSALFLQNEPNFKNTSIYISTCNTSCYGNFSNFFRQKNEPKRTQNEPNFSPKLASFFLNKPNFKPNSVKIGNLQRTILSETVYPFCSEFCVLCSVFFLPPIFVANNWLCFSTKIAVKWHAKIFLSLCSL